MPRSRSMLRAALAGVALGAVMAPTASAELSEVNTKRLRKAVTVNGILAHERALQGIANMNGDTRASGTPGYAASAAYVTNRLERAGYDVEQQEFTFPFFRDLAEPTLTVGAEEYEVGTLTFSGSGTVTGRIVPALNNQIPPQGAPGTTAAGCAPGDFAPADPAAPEIALVQRGACNFVVKAENARAAGYDAVIIFNEGQPGREILLDGTLGGLFDLPVVGLSYADGAELVAAAQAGTVIATLTTSTESDPEATTTNVIATSGGGNESEAVVIGAHLDSVVEGPGINDNGSGTSGILEIAEEMSELNIKPRRQLKFAFWGAEESGLLGSEHFVEQLMENGEVGDYYANLNFDMIGSPNYVRFVYDGDGSDTATSGPPGSAQIEAVFNQYFAGRGLATDPTAFDGRSDYGPFIEVGIPAGGLFTGAEGIKTEEQAEVYGGVAGEPYDPCYHKACDTIRNLSTRALNEMGDAAAHAALTLARSKTGFFEDNSLQARTKVRGKAGKGALAPR